MEIKTLEISGFRSALEAVHLPYTGEVRSLVTSHIEPFGSSIRYGAFCEISDSDMKLLSALVRRGDEHAKVIRGIIVYAKITAPIHFFWDEETYRAGHERLSSGSTMNTEGRGLSGDDLAKALHEVPFDRVITKADFFSYQCLRNMYFQRRNHRKNEWHEFCAWIESLPYSKELITIEK